MANKPRKLIVGDIEYRYLVSAPDEDYGAVTLRVFEGANRQPFIKLWLRSERQPVKPAFVAAQIEYNVNPVQFVRASGDCVCAKCKKPYYEHPFDGPFFGSEPYDTHQWLRRVCDGSLVKL